MLRNLRRGAGGLNRADREASTTTRARAPATRARRIPGTVVVCLALAGCAGGGSPADAEPEPALDNVEDEQLVETTVRVENRHWSDVNIYMFRRSARARVGTVTSNSTREFRIPLGMGQDGALSVYFLADAIGSDEEFLTERLSVLEGQEVLLRLEVRMTHSSASVFWP